MATSTKSTAAKKQSASGKSTAASKSAATKKQIPMKADSAQKSGTRCKATEFAQDQCKLSDYDIISDVLGSHKSLIKLYGTALCEISCEDLRNIVSSKMNECASDQLDAFLYMNERGMYKTEPAPIQKVKEARQKFAGTIKNIKK